MNNLATQAEALISALKVTRSDATDERTRTKLSSLHDELGVFLVGVAAKGKESETAIEHLEQIALRFEAEHPTVGAAVREAINTMVKAGI